MANTLLNPAAFYRAIRANRGPNRLTSILSSEQVETVNGILAAASHWPLNWVAYALATAWHEARFTNIPEIGRGSGKRYGKPGKYGQPQYGRGLSQLTWDYNYEWADKALRLDGALLKNFDLALRPDISTKVLVLGMETGAFTGKALRRYLPLGSKILGTYAQYKQARRIINGMDKADLIAGYAVKIQAALVLGAWGDHTVQPSNMYTPMVPTPPKYDEKVPFVGGVGKALGKLAVDAAVKTAADTVKQGAGDVALDVLRGPSRHGDTRTPDPVADAAGGLLRRLLTGIIKKR